MFFYVLVTTISKGYKMNYTFGLDSVELVLEILKRSVVMNSENKYLD